MAAPQHLLYTPEQAATHTLAALRYQSTLARIVNTDWSDEFTPGKGATVTVKNPIQVDDARTYTAANRASEDAITYSNLVQPYTSLTLSDQIYNAVKLPDDFMTFTIEDLDSQVVAPMAQSILDALNKTVAAAFATVKDGISAIDNGDPAKFYDTEGNQYDDIASLRAAGKGFAGKGIKGRVSVKNANLTATYQTDVLGTIRSAYQLLSQRGVPVTDRYLVVGANWESALLGLDNLNKVNEAGDNSVLRFATIGTLYGFTIVADYTIGANDAYALQKDAVTLATRTPVIPRGVSFGQTVAQDGFSLRYLHDYDADHLQDRAVVDTFAGAKVLDPQRIVKLKGADTIVAPKPAVSAG